MEIEAVEQGAERLFEELQTYLADKGRPLVPWGFEVESVERFSEPNAFMPEMSENETVVRLRVPVIWEPVRGSVPARASSTPSTHNLDELRDLIERGLRFGDYLHAGELVDWSPRMPDGAHPAKTSWSVEARIRSS
jgi:hypothetical protein